MSETSEGPGWWMASDRKWYPPEAHPDAEVPHGGGYVLSGGLTTATRILSWVSAGASVLLAGAMVNQALRFDDLISGNSPNFLNDFDSYQDAEDLAGSIAGLTFLVSIGLFVLMIIWLTKARRTANRFGGTNTTWSPGWAIGAWFIPLANVILVKLIFIEVERLSSADADPVPIGDRWKGGRLRADGWWWFFLGLAGIILSLVGSAMSNTSEEDVFNFDPDTFKQGLYVSAVGACLSAAALVVGAVMLKRLDGQLRRQVEET